MTFGQKLKALREACDPKMSEATLARKSGVAFGTLHNYGSGRRKPSLSAAVRIAKALNVSCDVWADCDDIAPPRPRGKR